MWTAIGIGAASLAGAAGSAYASGEAADDQADATGNASRMTMAQYRQSRGDLMPWQVTGKSANKLLAEYLGIDSKPTSGPDWDAYLRANPDVAASATYANNPAQHYEDYGRYEGRQVSMLPQGVATKSDQFGSLLKPFTGEDLENEPGYQFGLSEGEKAIERMARANGGINNGATMKALLRFNQDYGSTKFNEAFSRDASNKSSIYGMLSGVSGTGANVAGQTAGLGANAAGQSAGAIMAGGDARAAGRVGQANAWSDAISGGMSAWQNQNMMSYLQSLRQPTAAGTPFGYRWPT